MLTGATNHAHISNNGRFWPVRGCDMGLLIKPEVWSWQRTFRRSLPNEARRAMFQQGMLAGARERSPFGGMPTYLFGAEFARGYALGNALRGYQIVRWSPPSRLSRWLERLGA
jgi:hypothetical protein